VYLVKDLIQIAAGHILPRFPTSREDIEQVILTASQTELMSDTHQLDKAFAKSHTYLYSFIYYHFISVGE
jgi:hypothetical protein